MLGFRVISYSFKYDILWHLLTSQYEMLSEQKAANAKKPNDLTDIKKKLTL